MNDIGEIKNAIKILQNEGFKVIKLSERMKKDIKECNEMNSIGKDKDCLGCSCNICLMQDY
jgi:hypothetical protein